ncbi:MAG: methyltransferase [Halioglobus sp.]|nr:methyltransferase [Halioglobus sp.]
MANEIRISGFAQQGRQKAEKQFKSFDSELSELTGCELYPGTLNLILDRPIRLNNETARYFDSGKRMIWKARLEMIDVWVYRWPHTPLHVVEILARDKLRETLNLTSSIKLELFLESQDLVKILLPARIIWSTFWLGRKTLYYRSEFYAELVRNCSRWAGATQLEGIFEGSMNSKVRQKLKNLPGALNTVRWFRRNITKPIRNRMLKPSYDLFQRKNTGSSESDNFTLNQVLNVLNYTKHSGQTYSADQFPAGYHTLRLFSQEIRGQRDPKARLAVTPINFVDISVLDVGCNQGGMLFEVADSIRWGVGLDYDSNMVNAATKINFQRSENNLSFYKFDLEKDPLDLIQDFLPEGRVDMVFLLSVCMWIRNWQEVIACLAYISDSMLFESNGSNAQQDEQAVFLKQIYGKVELIAGDSPDDPSQKNRRLYLCSDRDG